MAAGRIAARRQERRQSRALKSIAAFREKAERIYWDIFDGKPLDRHLEDPGLPKEIRAIVECVVARAGSGPVENLGAEAPAMSVVIPHYNHAQYLGDCLEGLCRQTVAPTEVVVVDDLSDDRPELPRICKGFEGRLNLRLLLPDRKLYCGGARQMGAEVSTAEIVVMHDADDVSHPERLEITREVFRRNPGTWHLTAGWVPFDGVAVDYVKEFDLSVLDKSVVGPAELAAAMSRLFAEQRFSQDVCGQTLGPLWRAPEIWNHGGALRLPKASRRPSPMAHAGPFRFCEIRRFRIQPASLFVRPEIAARGLASRLLSATLDDQPVCAVFRLRATGKERERCLK